MNEPDKRRQIWCELGRGLRRRLCIVFAWATRCGMIRGYNPCPGLQIPIPNSGSLSVEEASSPSLQLRCPLPSRSRSCQSRRSPLPLRCRLAGMIRNRNRSGHRWSALDWQIRVRNRSDYMLVSSLKTIVLGGNKFTIPGGSRKLVDWLGSECDGGGTGAGCC